MVKGWKMRTPTGKTELLFHCGGMLWPTCRGGLELAGTLPDVRIALSDSRMVEDLARRFTNIAKPVKYLCYIYETGLLYAPVNTNYSL